MVLAQFIIAIILLAAGRKMIWLFVALTGFLVAMRYTAYFFWERPDWFVLAIALAAGVVGALLALYLQKLAAGVAGFLAGGYVASSLSGTAVVVAGQTDWTAFIIGGVIGAFLVLLMFDWALIVLSSAIGAAILAEAVAPNYPLNLAVLLAAGLAGIYLQGRQLLREKRSN